MHNTPHEDPAALLISVVQNARTLSDEQKETYLHSIIEEGVIPKELDIQALCDAEEAATVQEITDLNAGKDAVQAAKQTAEDEAAPELNQLAKDHQIATQQVVNDLKTEGVRMEKSMSQELETEADSAEQSQAEALRKMLKQKPEEQ